VLTADQQNQSARTGVPVFADTTARDAAFGGAGEKTLAEGQLCYLEDTNKVQYYDGAAWANLGSVTNVEAFTASGTFTPPAGVTYAIAHIRAGGGGQGVQAAAATGGTFGCVCRWHGYGNGGGNGANAVTYDTFVTGAANSGQNARAFQNPNGQISGGAGAYIVAGGAVTPAVGITVTVGAGGTAGTSGAAGGSGYVWIEYQV
jgi:hypothetical protein